MNPMVLSVIIGSAMAFGYFLYNYLAERERNSVPCRPLSYDFNDALSCYCQKENSSLETITLSCNHKFHLECLELLIKNNSLVCPECLQEIPREVIRKWD